MYAKIRRTAGVLPALFALAAMLLFLAFPTRYTESVRQGVSLWAVCVLPATFPFLFLTALFSQQKLFFSLAKGLSPAMRLFALSGAGGSAALLSVLSGYPVGARAVADLSRGGFLSKEEVFRTACLASTSGPMFLVGAVGARMFGSAAAGAVLLCGHLLGVCTGSLLLRIGKRAPRSPVPPVRGGEPFSALIGQSVLAVLSVGGSIALFYAFGQMAADLLSFARIPPLAEGVIRGLIEMTSGCNALAGEITPLRLALCCFLVTFGGSCVLAQQWIFLSETGIRFLPFLAVKAAQGIFAALFCFALALLL